jgi:hypothetical protein
MQAGEGSRLGNEDAQKTPGVDKLGNGEENRGGGSINEKKC